MEEGTASAGLLETGGVPSSPEPAAESNISPTGDGGSQSPAPSSGESSWYSGLSEELQSDPFVQKYGSMEEALKGGASASKMIGNSIRLPGEDATPDELDKIYNKLGRPESADGYDLKAPTFKDDDGNEHAIFDMNDEAGKMASESFHKLRLTPEQANGVMQLYGQQRIADLGDANEMMQQQQVEMGQESQSQLMQEWGDKYEANMSIAKKAAERFGIMEDVNELGLGNSASMIKMLHTLSEHIGESKLTGDFSASGGGFEEAIANIEKSPEFNDKSHPGHAAVAAKRLELYKKKYQ